MVWLVVLVTLAVVLGLALVYDRRRHPRVRPGSGTREHDHGEGLYRGGLGTGPLRDGPGDSGL